MIETLELPSKEFSLTLACVNEKGWCTCNLIRDDLTILLGAETQGYIMSHLLEGLRDSDSRRILGRINDHNVYGVLALAETHYALYVGDDETDKVLVWQNKMSNEIVGVNRITDLERLRWIELLDNWK